MPERASGFCVYDDPAIAVAWLLANGAERIAYVDVDVHHGDGPQAIFLGEPSVLTISLHQTGLTLFPGTGFIQELGAGEAKGTKVNVPLPPGTGDEGWLRAFEEIVPALVEAWKPTVLVTQLGCDTHHTDPLAMLGLTTNAYAKTAIALHELAHRAAGGRWVATGGGGYQWARVVPRAWTIYFAQMCDVAIPDQIPESWIETAEREAGQAVPATLSEPPVASRVNDHLVAGVIEEVKKTIFPYHGLAV
jgi:acetoin utilization protein AcuC